MKKTLTTLLLAACCIAASAQGIDFNDGKTFNEILNMAAQQQKPVLIDCYTSWCGPCKMMATKEFVKPEAGDYFNPRFVCWKCDMEKGEGPELLKRFDVNAFPTFLVLTPDGTLKGRYVGANSIEGFIKKIEDIMADEKGLSWYQKKFNDGERDAKFIDEYVALLKQNYMNGELKNVAAAMLEGKSGTQIVADTTLYKTFKMGQFLPTDDVFGRVYSCRDAILSAYGDKAVQELENTWLMGAYRCMKFEGKTWQGFDEDAFTAYVQKMRDAGVPDVEQKVDYIRFANAMYAKDIPTMLSYMEKDLKEGGTILGDDAVIQVMGPLLKENAHDKKMMKTFKKVAQQRIANLKKKDITGEPSYIIKGVKKSHSEYLTEQFQEILNELNGK